MRSERGSEALLGLASELPPEIAFLAGRVPEELLAEAGRCARARGTSAQRELFATGALGAEPYAKALALHLGGSFQSSLHPDMASCRLLRRRAPQEAARLGLFLLRSGPDGIAFAVNAESENLGRVLAALRRQPYAGKRVVVVTAGTFHEGIARGRAPAAGGEPIGSLMPTPAELSARGGLSPGQKQTLAITLLALAASFLAVPDVAAPLFLIAATLFFFALSAFRLWAGLTSSTREPPPLPEEDLPVYTVLVPLYREAAVVRRLVAALMRLDYPTAKLDIKLLLEADDEETREEVARRPLPPHFETVLVPPSEPRTKPKALNAGLLRRRGDLVCIFDAEDRPAPEQLRLAAATFAADPEIVCLQARLAMYNWRDNWLSRQFALEYAVLFDVVLPHLDAKRLPIPLGGTSNHFRADILEAAGAWDAFNVTEDADLGIRLTRLGHRCASLPVTTWEEAPNTLSQWLPQRTRWLKGWMQTYAVHMRKPGDLRRRLGWRGFAAFQILVGGPIVSALMHPFFFGFLWVHTLSGHLLLGGEGWAWAGLNVLAGGNLCLAYGSAFMLAFLALERRRMTGMLFEIATMPACWLLVSAAAYRAAWQFFAEPFKWEKTEHGRDRTVAMLVPLARPQGAAGADDPAGRAEEALVRPRAHPAPNLPLPEGPDRHFRAPAATARRGAPRGLRPRA